MSHIVPENRSTRAAYETTSSTPTKATPPSESSPVTLFIYIVGASVIILLLIFVAFGFFIFCFVKANLKERLNTKSDHMYRVAELTSSLDLLKYLSPPDLPNRKPPGSVPKSTSTVPPNNLYDGYSSLPDLLKEELLDDPLITDESRDKIREELAKSEPRLGIEEHYSKYSTLTDAEKKNLLEDPFIADETRDKIREELAKSASRVRFDECSSKCSILVDTEKKLS